MTDAETFSFHSSISIAISSAWCKLCRTIFHLKIKKWSPLWLLYPHHVGSYAELSALHVPVCCCNHGRPPIQQWWRGIKAVQTGSPIIKIEITSFSEVKSTALPVPSPFWYMRLPAQKETFQKFHALLLIKNFWRSLIHLHIYFQSLGIKFLQDMNIYKFCQGWDKKPDGEEESLWKKFTRRSLTKAHLLVIVLDMRR